MKDIANLTFRLFIICALAAAALGWAYSVTKTPIEEGALARAEAARKAVLSEADSFEEIDVETLKADGSWLDDIAHSVVVEEAYYGMTGGEKNGMTVKVTTKGYNPGIEVTIGLRADGTVEAIDIGSHEETPGLGANATKPEFTGQFADRTPLFSLNGADGSTQIDALTSATFTSNGVVNGVNAAYDFFKAVYNKE